MIVYTASPPPWGVPNRRKPRGSRRDCLMLYDPHEGYLFSSRDNEVITQNRYSPLNRCSKEPDFYRYDSKKKRPLQDFGQKRNRELSRRGSHRRRDGHPGEDPVYYYFCPLCTSINNDNNNFLCKIKYCENYLSDYIYYPYDNNNKIKTDLNLYSNHYPTSSDSKYPSQSYTKHRKSKSSHSKCTENNKTTTRGGSYKFGNDLRNFVKNQRSGAMIKT